MTQIFDLDTSGLPPHPHIAEGDRLFPVFDCTTHRWLVRTESNYLVGWLPPSMPFTFEQMGRVEMQADWQRKAMRVRCELAEGAIDD